MKLFGNHVRERKSPDVISINSEPVLAEKEAPFVETPSSEQSTFTCQGCGKVMPLHDIKQALYVCPECGKHAKISARRRLMGIADPGTFRKLKSDIPFRNPLDYPDYEAKISGLKEKTGLEEGVLSGVCEIEGHKTVVVIMASEFLMGSMGIAVGEMVTSAFEAAEKFELPIIIFTASGGARMQEGIHSCRWLRHRQLLRDLVITVDFISQFLPILQQVVLAPALQPLQILLWLSPEHLSDLRVREL